MAQFYAIEFIGAIEAKANTALTTASILGIYPSATVMKIKTKDVNVSVNNSVLFQTTYDGENYIQTGNSYKFDKDCILAIGKYRVVS